MPDDRAMPEDDRAMPEDDRAKPEAAGAKPEADRAVPDNHDQPKTQSGATIRAQLIVAVLLAALGFAAVVQVRLTRTDDDFSGQRRDDLVELLDSLSGAADRTRTQIDDLERTRLSLLSTSERRQAADVESENQISVLEILTGAVAATGPGVVITISDSEQSVDSATLLNGIDELRDAGAEAIEINDVVRVVASTAFTMRGDTILADGVELRPPYVIDAIGSSHTLSEAVVFPGGLSSAVSELGGSVEVTESDVVDVGSLHTIKQPEYSRASNG